MVETEAPVLESFTGGRWFAGTGNRVDVPSAVDGRVVARVSSDGVDFGAAVRFARGVGGPALRALTFHARAALLKDVASYLQQHKAELYEVSFDTGATLRDHYVDVDGGIGTLFSYASKGRRELPDEGFVLEGGLEPLGKRGTFVARHLLTSLHGVAVHINAYNFPVW
ncbi:MAG: aldehyde dehydrogenase family protein, partial [Candidatus Eremiobacteraeota bacterium]|nr:aldehyde dehydrogenase family protein [Candidatus Eremiobacteraeota bacterium]